MEQAQKTPDAVALHFSDRKYTYRTLNQLSNGLAFALRKSGVKKGDFVGALLDRNEWVIITQLAVLKLGAVFIPIDSRYPKDRIEYIVENSNIKILLKNESNMFQHKKIMNIEALAIEKISFIECEKVNADDVCYVIFTSGSTGKPKGCMLTNKGLVNFCKNNNILSACNQLEKQVFVSVNTISFDFFIAESLLPLVNGYTVVLASEEESIKQDLFRALVMKLGVNIAQTTPTRFNIYFNDKKDISYMKQFEIIVSSGEALPLELLEKFCKYTNAKIFNPLGPSECSVWAVGGDLQLSTKKVEKNDISIGKPIANTQVYILDQKQQLLPIGVAGELCIAGDGVGKGYLNQPELTNEKFIKNPFATKENGHGNIMYRTGDLVLWRENGDIEYLGRIDTQVKIRGLRIELGEIECVLNSYQDIQLSAVADKRDENGRQYLVGYYTADKDIDEKQLRQYLAKKLPKYMIPNYLFQLSEMPMTASGKIARNNLPQPDFKVKYCEYQAPESAMQIKLCNLIADVLEVERIGIKDDFFEYGGDSLKAIELVAKAHDMGIDLSLQCVFDYPTVETLSDYLEKVNG